VAKPLNEEPSPFICSTPGLS